MAEADRRIIGRRISKREESLCDSDPAEAGGRIPV